METVARQAPGLIGDQPRALQVPLRWRLEAALETDLSQVRVHDSERALDLGARAFTLGRDIYFAPGMYQPHTAAGKKLIGHEVAHVVQQRAGRVGGPGPIVDDAALEHEAAQFGDGSRSQQVERAPNATSSPNTPGHPVIQRSLFNQSDIDQMRADDRKKRAESSYRARVSRGANVNSSPEEAAADWARSGQQQQAEIERGARSQWWQRHTLDKRKVGLVDQQFVEPPAPSDAAMHHDFAQAEHHFARNAWNARQQDKQRESGEWNVEIDAAKGVVKSKSFTADLGHVPDPANPGRLSAARKQQLLGLLHETGRVNAPKNGAGEYEGPKPLTVASDATRNLSKEQGERLASWNWKFRGSPTNEDPSASQADWRRAEHTAAIYDVLGTRRASGVQDKRTGVVLGKLFGLHSKMINVEDAAGGAVNLEPLGHSHSAHGFETKADEQIERALYGIRPDDRGKTAASTPTVNPVPVAFNRLVGRDADEVKEFAAIKAVSEFPQIAKGKGSKVGTGGFSSQFRDPIPEYAALQHNFAEAWQARQAIAAHGDLVKGKKRAAVTSKNTIGPLQHRVADPSKLDAQDYQALAKAWTPAEYGRGFKVEKSKTAALGGGAVTKLDRTKALGPQNAQTQERAENVTVTGQASATTVFEIMNDKAKRFNGFNVVTHFPSVDPAEVTNDAGNIAAVHTPKMNNPRTDENDVNDSLAAIHNTSKIGNVPYKFDPAMPIGVAAKDKHQYLLRDKADNRPILAPDPLNIKKLWTQKGF